MRRTLLACTLAAAFAASREVHKLRAANSACTLNFTRGPEPTKRFVVFTKQRSGSRWFVNALALRSNGTFQTHIPEIEFRGFGLREIRIDSSPKSSVAWAKVLYQLGAWPRVDVERVKRLRRAEARGAGLVTSFRNAHAPQVMIHGSKPISATIGNYNAVYRVLKGTPHEWMLERHLEPK